MTQNIQSHQRDDIPLQYTIEQLHLKETLDDELLPLKQRQDNIQPPKHKHCALDKRTT
jgi:hypothetical protein